MYKWDAGKYFKNLSQKVGGEYEVASRARLGG